MNEIAFQNPATVEGFSILKLDMDPTTGTDLKQYVCKDDQGFIQIMVMAVDDKQGAQVVDFATCTSHIPQRMHEFNVGEKE